MILSALLQNVDWTLLYGEEKEINKIIYLYVLQDFKQMGINMHKKQ